MFLVISFTQLPNYSITKLPNYQISRIAFGDFWHFGNFQMSTPRCLTGVFNSAPAADLRPVMLPANNGSQPASHASASEIPALVFQFNFYPLQPVFCHHTHRLAVRKSSLCRARRSPARSGMPQEDTALRPRSFWRERRRTASSTVGRTSDGILISSGADGGADTLVRHLHGRPGVQFIQNVFVLVNQALPFGIQSHSVRHIRPAYCQYFSAMALRCRGPLFILHQGGYFLERAHNPSPVLEQRLHQRLFCRPPFSPGRTPPASLIAVAKMLSYVARGSSACFSSSARLGHMFHCGHTAIMATVNSSFVIIMLL